MTMTAHREPQIAAATTETLTMAGALGRALADALTEDPRVFVYGEDVADLGGVFRITDGLSARFGRDRCFNTPLAEAGIAGHAVGMAMNGMVPVIEMQFDSFAYPAFEQIVAHMAKLRNRTRGGVSLPIVIRIPYAGNIGGVEHHCDSSETYYAHTPGLTVVSPTNPQDAYTMLRAAIAFPDPVIFLEPKKLYWAKGEVDTTEPADGWASALTGARTVRAGTDVTLIAYGPTVVEAEKAAAIAESEGRSVEVIDLRSLFPLDTAALVASVERTGRAVVVSEAHRFAGYAAEVAAQIAEDCFHVLEAPVRRVAAPDVPYAPPGLERHYLPDAERILDAIDDLQWEY